MSNGRDQVTQHQVVESSESSISIAMILAAGFGARMRPLTLHTPKPLLKVAGKSLIVYHIERLAALGIGTIVINVAYLGEQIEQALGSGEQWGVQLHYSYEPEPLETAGAIAQALPLLGESPFLLVNADVWMPFEVNAMAAELAELSQSFVRHPTLLGHLWLVPNPPFKPRGDFMLNEQQRLLPMTNRDGTCVDTQVGVNTGYTFSGVSVLHPQLVAAYPQRRSIFPLREVFDWAMQSLRLSASDYTGDWEDVGTPERLAELDQRVQLSIKG